ncbi:MAG: OmpA family protein [Desulfobacterales bacterium]|nr:OmpA family protein [Desulfobacterales bacterium]
MSITRRKIGGVISVLVMTLVMVFPSEAAVREKCQGFIVLVDASGTMMQKERGRTGLKVAKKVLTMMNERIPPGSYLSALRVFGHDLSYEVPYQSEVYAPVATYSESSLQAAIDRINNKLRWSWSPIGYGLEMSGHELMQMSGRVHIIVVSDGDENSQYILPRDAVKELKNKYPDQLCIYAIQIGATPRGKIVLDNIVDAAGCGRRVLADDLLNDEAALDRFVDDVFVEHYDLDSDGDGVVDRLDKCPGTPKGVAVDKDGCPLDTDGDGVYDYLDDCPGTPWGAPVNRKGCWIIPKIFFDYDQADLRPKSIRDLDGIARIMLINPDLVLEVDGHASTEGTVPHNDKLSLRRARAVREYLTGKGVAADALPVKAFGEHKPAVADSTSEAAREKNRRVLFRRK